MGICPIKSGLNFSSVGQKRDSFMYLRYEWAKCVLVTLGNSTPSVAMIDFIVAWTVAETAPPTPDKPGASYNLLNTRHTMPGSTNCNAAGVQNFLTFADGCRANVNALLDGFYPALSKALVTNDEHALGFPDGPVPSVIVAELAKWSGGSQYGAHVLSLIGRGINDTFLGSNTFWKEVQAYKIWNSTGMKLDYGTPIALAWRGLNIGSRKPGPPLTGPYSGNDWSGNVMLFQEFANLHAEQNAAGLVRFYDLLGVLIT